MNIKSSHRLTNTISEMKVNKPTPTYSDSYINTFTKKVSDIFNKNKETFTKYYNTIYGISMGDMLESQLKYESLLENIESIETLLNNTVNKCGDIIQTYEYLNEPPNIKQLDDLSNNLDRLSWDYHNLKNALESILEAGRQLNKQYYNK
jgi:hypothetical protein